MVTRKFKAFSLPKVTKFSKFTSSVKEQGTGKIASAWVVRAAAWYTFDCEDYPGIALGRQVIS